MLSAFSVVNLNDQGSGSLRQAILDADAAGGAEVINFSVTGTILLTSGALPTITDAISIEGTTALGFAGAPLVEVDCNGFGGLQFNSGATGAALTSLAIVDATGNGVTISGGGQMIVDGNFIGLGLDGATVQGNTGNGLEIDASSGNVINDNTISGNGANGIDLNGSNSNQVSLNYIGTDVNGTVGLGNAANGILLTGGSSANVIGGASGNLISANGANGVLITGGAIQNSLTGNLIGTDSSGTTALGNALDGVSVVNANSNLIGNTDAVSSVTYNSLSSVTFSNTVDQSPQPVSGLTGIRNSTVDGHYLVTGNSGSNGLLYDGTMAGVGTAYAVNFPLAASTNVYGPDNQGTPNITLVGTYKNSDSSTAVIKVHSFVYEGTKAGLTLPGNYQSVDHPQAEFTYLHSTMNGLAVGNYDNEPDHGQANVPYGPGHAFIYNIAQSSFPTDIVYPGSKSNTAYGIWYNGGTSYTIAGGWSPNVVNNFEDQNQPIGHAYLVDYDSATGKFTNWTSFDYPYGTNFLTHFQGISSVEKGVYTMSADSVQSGTSNPTQGSLVTVVRNADGSFGPASWINLSDGSSGLTSSDSVYGKPGCRCRNRQQQRCSLPCHGPPRLSVVQRDQRQRRQWHRPVRRQRQRHRDELHRHRCHRHTGHCQRRQWHPGDQWLHGRRHWRTSHRRQRPDQRHVRPAAAGQPHFGQQRQWRAHHRQRQGKQPVRQLHRHRLHGRIRARQPPGRRGDRQFKQ